jgi:hypothetical protein
VIEKTQVQDYKKQVAVIMPRWCINMILDHLDMQYDSLQQEQDFHSRVGDTKSFANAQDELKLYNDAIDQIAGQLDNS